MVYHLYGARLDSAWRLPYSRIRRPFVADIALIRRTAAYFSDARAAAARLPQQRPTIVEGTLADGQTYLQWPDRFEFLISVDGRQIAARPIGDGFTEGFHTHLLGQALSVALIRHGLDPLHATVVTADGGGVAFLGHSGYGKSTLAAALLSAGCQVLTDDLLVLTDGQAGLAAHPGPPRLKLYPDAARRLLPGATGVPMMQGIPKRLFRLPPRHIAPGPVPLRAMYVLVPPGPRTATSRGVRIRRLGAREACLALIRNTFNASVLDADRLARQFALSARVAVAVPVKSLSYPRSFAVMPAVCEAIRDDLAAEAAS